MKILAIGDIVGTAATDFVSSRLWGLRSTLGVDFVIANGENAWDIKGIRREQAQALLDGGVDVITTGNHVWGQRDIYSFLDDDSRIIRPANFPGRTPGSGYTVVEADGYRILCMNAQGTALMEPLDSPFEAVDKILEREAGNYDLSILDFHAEATSEKIAMGYYLDGRVNIVFGTHTHVQTSDAKVLPGGTGYVTDIGMTGPEDGVLGAAAGPVLEKFLTHMPTRFSVAQGEVHLWGAIFDLDTSSGKVRSVECIRI